MVVQTNDKNVPRTVEQFDYIYLSNNNPWMQDGTGEYSHYNHKSRTKLGAILSDFDGNITEVGCGLGYVIEYLKIVCGFAKVTGVDLSPIAVEKAKKLFPKLDFKVADITKQVIKSDIIVLNEILWYILHDIDSAIDNCRCKYLVINTGFLKKQKYDRDIIDGWSGLLRYLVEKKFIILHSEYDSGGLPFMNGIVVCTRQK